MTYPEAIDWLFSTQMFGIKLGLEGPRRLLRETLAYPAHGVKVIHVAGTNGKGSTCAMIDSIARACGLRTGLFTSPHLVDYCERTKVSGRDIPQDECARLLTALRRVCEVMETHPTFFEISLALSMLWFRERECELIILETGMGGRLDATTAVPADVCAITPVALDHMQWLGSTLEEIATEKAGIFVTGKPTISAPQLPSIRGVLECEANVCRCPLTFVEEPLLGYFISLPGVHQKWNAALAAAALHAAHVPMRFESLQDGLSSVRWPGRFEVIRTRLSAYPVVLDGAHNPHAARVLAETWMEVFPGEKPVMVFSAVATKDVSGILAELTPLAERIHICPVATPRALATGELIAFLPGDSPPFTAFDSFGAAFDAALACGRPILVAGSLFLVGEARAGLNGGSFQACTQ